MISLRKPSRSVVERLLAQQAERPYNYPDVGATQATPPAGWNVDRTVAEIGSEFEAAKAAIDAWQPFGHDWITVVAPGPPRVGTCVAVVAHVAGLWWVDISRVVYTIDEPDRYGFAYGTLPMHAERGEERFEVIRTADTVRYEVLAFSKPNHILAKLGAPFARRAQKAFARGSIAAMQRAAR